MKMNKILTVALATTMVSGVLLAEESTGSVATSTASSESILSKLEKSPFKLSFYTEHGVDTNRNESNEPSDESKGNTMTTYNALYTGKLAYNISSKTSASIYGRFDTTKDLNTTDLEAAKQTGAWNRVILAVRQKVLSEARNGVDLGITLEKRSLPDTKIRGDANVNGHTRLVTNVSKSFGKFSLSATHYLAVIDRKDTTRTTTRYYNDIITEQAFAITDKLSFSTYQDYFQPKNKGEAQNELNTDTIELGAGLSYAATSKLSVGIGASSIAFKSHDGKSSDTRDWTKTPSYGVNLAFNAF